jgi:hypothetical protein
MSRILSFARLCILLSICAGFGLGCKKSDVTFDTIPVSGKVTVDGHPVTDGQVSFIPFDKEQKAGGMCTGKIDVSGGYVLYTDGKDGAPPGRYKVTVTPSMVPTGGNKMPTMPFNIKYSEVAKTDLIVIVSATASPGSYDLKLSK